MSLLAGRGGCTACAGQYPSHRRPRATTTRYHRAAAERPRVGAGRLTTQAWARRPRWESTGTAEGSDGSPRPSRSSWAAWNPPGRAVRPSSRRRPRPHRRPPTPTSTTRRPSPRRATATSSTCTSRHPVAAGQRGQVQPRSRPHRHHGRQLRGLDRGDGGSDRRRPGDGGLGRHHRRVEPGAGRGRLLSADRLPDDGRLGARAVRTVPVPRRRGVPGVPPGRVCHPDVPGQGAGGARPSSSACPRLPTGTGTAS
jgi:hypothetical protein